MFRSFVTHLFVPALLLGLAALGPLRAQTLDGTLRDANSRRAIGNANVRLEGTELGTISGPDGRFVLRLTGHGWEGTLVVSHVSYDTLRIPLAEARGRSELLLVPRVIPVAGTEVTEEGSGRTAVARDLPQSVVVLAAREFELGGYADAADLLRGDAAVHVDETSAGRKTLSLRGGNADDVLVLYDGFALNGAADDAYDFSLVDLAGIERLEIVEGSNTSIFGPDGFSGVVNVVPAFERPYTLRAEQEIGSYDAGRWALQAARNFGGLQAAYDVRSGGSSRAFLDAPDLTLDTRTIHHAGHLRLGLGGSDDAPSGTLTALGRYAWTRLADGRDDETLDRASTLGGARYAGALGPLRDATIAAAYTSYVDDTRLRASETTVAQTIRERALQAEARAQFGGENASLLIGYQFHGAGLDVNETRDDGIVRTSDAGTSTHTQHGALLIGHLRGETGSAALPALNVDAALRYDAVRDDMDVPGAPLRPAVRRWDAATFKVAVGLHGASDETSGTVFLSFGRNVKFPTLMQQAGVPLSVSSAATAPLLDPEKNTSIELGASMASETTNGGNLSGWRASASYFQNAYDNKFRTLAVPGSTVPLYDNIRDARISGLEGRCTIFFFRRILGVEFGIARNTVSDASAFPFKPDSKRTLGVTAEYGGAAFRLIWFAEGEQLGVLRQTDGTYVETAIAAAADLDLHASYRIPAGPLTLFAAANGYNLVGGDNAAFNGLALRERRYTATVGVEW